MEPIANYKRSLHLASLICQISLYPLLPQILTLLLDIRNH